MLGAIILIAMQVDHAGVDTQSPQIRNLNQVITPQDYPSEATAKTQYGIVSIVVQVSATGRAMSCLVTETSGHASLDKRTCSLFLARSRFKPARSVDGTAVDGEYRMATAWGIDRNFPRTSSHIPLRVSEIPADYQRPVKVQLIFDASGRVKTCEIMMSSGSNAADLAACTYFKRQFVIDAPKSSSDAVPAMAVRYVTVPLSIQTVRPDK